MNLASVFAWANLTLGASLALAAASPFAGAALTLFALVQPSQAPDLADQPLARWIAGIAGGVWAGWGASMVRSLAGATPVESVRTGLLVWCALDSLASATNGAWANVLVNLSWIGFGWLATRSSGAAAAGSAAYGTRG